MTDNLANKKKIIRAMFVLLKGQTLDRLAVSDVCTEAGVSRQTFYRCFEDKYAAALWYTNCIVDGTCRRIGFSLSWRDGYLSFFRIIERNVNFMKKLSESRDYNSIYSSTIRLSEEDYRNAYQLRQGKNPEGIIDFQITSFARIATNIVTEWIDSGCRISADIYIDYFLSLVPDNLFRAIEIESVPTEDDPFSLLQL